MIAIPFLSRKVYLARFVLMVFDGLFGVIGQPERDNLDYRLATST